MNWETHAHAAMVDLTAALTGARGTAAGHLTDAIDNINKAIDALEDADDRGTV